MDLENTTDAEVEKLKASKKKTRTKEEEIVNLYSLAFSDGDIREAHAEALEGHPPAWIYLALDNVSKAIGPIETKRIRNYLDANVSRYMALHLSKRQSA